MKEEPARIKTLGQFMAANPWSGLQSEEWSLELCEVRQVPKDSPIHMGAAGKAQPLTRLKRGELLVLRADSDFKRYIVPYTVAQLYVSGTLKQEALLALLVTLGPTKILDANRPSHHRWLLGVACMILLLALLRFFATSIQVSNEGTFEKVDIFAGLMDFIAQPMIWLLTLLAFGFLVVGILYALRYRRIVAKVRTFIQKQREEGGISCL